MKKIILLLMFSSVLFSTEYSVEAHNKKVNKLLKEADGMMKEADRMDKINKEDFGNFNLTCEAYFVAAGHELQLGSKLEKAALNKEAGEAYKKADKFYKYILNNCDLSSRATKRIHNLITFK